MSRAVVMVAGVLLTVAFVSGCTIGENDQETHINIEKVDVSKYEAKVVEAEFQGVMNEKFVDIEVDGKLQMLRVSDGLVDDFAALEVGAPIRLSYEFQKEELQDVIIGLLEVNGKEYMGLKPLNDQIVEINKVDEATAYEPIDKGELTIGDKKVGSYSWDMSGVLTKAPMEYTRDKNSLKSKNVKLDYYLVEDTPANDIQNERWRAASVLNEIAPFKEEKQEDDSPIKFLFYAEKDGQYKEIMVIRRGEKYIRFEWEAKDKETYYEEIKAIIDQTR